ncbi:MAG: HTH-type transcriptional regulator GalR [Lentisphaerae bacterium ADurb.Bin242]|nr:MAG: HTH-type transcriptional regulator GalR [Lentisphaerae bacterium ADurb.Bin242]
MAHGITLGKLAKLAGVSPATVSIVLNRHPLASRIPEHTQEKIKQFAKLHNYFPNHLAKAMKQQSTGIIGFVCGDIAQPFYAELCSELTLAVERRGCRLMTMLTQWSFEKEIEALEQLFSNALDGAVIFSQAFTECNERSDRFRKPGIPLVTISDFNNIGVCRVASDFRPGMEALFELLTANGFTRFSAISGEI